MSFAFFAALGGLVVTLATLAVLNARDACRQPVRARADTRRKIGRK